MSTTSEEAESLVLEAASLSDKIRLVVTYHAEVSAITKADVFNKAIGSGDVPLQLACLELVQSPAFAESFPPASELSSSALSSQPRLRAWC